ncbi:Hypothetical protein, putative [Bodo saltans]|uniref:Uncharacterized protein n=1 Tax=Bodo saltans TaxID=75058 RepID=A0A0S4J3D9_BODSA|nr:Hypothetical protein, putative [Bodo saltans]|eukprot:CUG76983.1 Hypothetical protein, putative [Bodo saltans]
MQMQIELNAMKAAQINDACPPGFAAKTFAVLATECKRDATRFAEDIRIKEEDIRASVNDIRKKEDDIRKREDEIASLRNVGLELKPNQTHNVVPPCPKFTTVQEACDVLWLRPEATTAELSTAVPNRCNETVVTDGLIGGVKKLMNGFGKIVDKSLCPLLCVFGASGQGKTDALKFIRNDAGLQKSVIKAINAHDKASQCTHVIPLFATFHRSSTYDVLDEPAVRSLCNRLLSNYLGVTFDSSQSKRFDNITLNHLTEFIREEEASSLGRTPDEICVIVLVDEMLNVIDGAAWSPNDSVSQLLNAICSTQQAALEQETHLCRGDVAGSGDHARTRHGGVQETASLDPALSLQRGGNQRHREQNR